MAYYIAVTAVYGFLGNLVALLIVAGAAVWAYGRLARTVRTARTWSSN